MIWLMPRVTHRINDAIGKNVTVSAHSRDEIYNMIAAPESLWSVVVGSDSSWMSSSRKTMPVSKEVLEAICPAAVNNEAGPRLQRLGSGPVVQYAVITAPCRRTRAGRSGDVSAAPPFEAVNR